MIFKLDRRYIFSGRLTLTTALHIGGGRGTLSPSESPVIRTAEGIPLIPGSSFKGVFRGTVEKIAGSIPTLRTCAMMSNMNCVGSDASLRAEFDRRWRAEAWSDDQLMQELQRALCDTCQLFGSQYAASHLLFSDLHPTSPDVAVTQIRDGVGIDRDSENAVPQIKYDFEVIEHNIDFDLRLVLENPSERDVQLTCIGLAELAGGYVMLGGKRSRGLGRCVLTNLRIHELDLTEPATALQRLRTYLLTNARQSRNATDSMTAGPDATAFLEQHIEALFATEDPTHA